MVNEEINNLYYVEHAVSVLFGCWMTASVLIVIANIVHGSTDANKRYVNA